MKSLFNVKKINLAKKYLNTNLFRKEFTVVRNKKIYNQKFKVNKYKLKKVFELGEVYKNEYLNTSLLKMDFNQYYSIILRENRLNSFLYKFFFFT